MIYNKSYFIQGLLPSWYYAQLAGVAISRLEAQRKVRFPNLEPALRRFQRPLLMMHGQMDAYIRPEMAQRLFALAREPKELWLIPEAKHNLGLHVAGDEYRRRVQAFFDAHLAEPPAACRPHASAGRPHLAGSTPQDASARTPVASRV